MRYRIVLASASIAYIFHARDVLLLSIKLTVKIFDFLFVLYDNCF